MPKTASRPAPHGQSGRPATVTPELEQHIERTAASFAEATMRAMAALPDDASIDQTTRGDAREESAPPKPRNRAQRRAEQRVERKLLSDIERRNRKQLMPHYITAGLLGLAQVVHSLAAQAHAVGVAAMLTGVACGAAGVATHVWLRRREHLLSEWTLWSGLLAAATSLWMVSAVVSGFGWGSLALALAGDYAFGARWWAANRHPEAVEPVPATEPEAAPVEVDASLLAHFPRRWAQYLGAPGCILAGSQLVSGEPFEHGIEYILRLLPGKQDLDSVRANMSKIASGLGHPETKLTVDPYGENPDLVRFRVVTNSPVAGDVYFHGPQFDDGKIVLGPYIDGLGDAVWRLYTDNSIWGGLIVGGTGSGKSRLIDVIALTALYTGCTYVIHVDGQDGMSCPQLWEHAQERYGADDADYALRRLIAMQQYRQRNRRSGGHGFNPASDYPGILVIVDEAHVVVTKENAEKWAKLAREARKVGIAVIMADQDGSLETFKKSVLRGSLRAGNAVGLRTDERSQGQILAHGQFNLHDLPAIPGYGHTLGEAARHAPFKNRWVPTREDAAKGEAKGKALPAELRLVEDWYEQAPKIRLDHGTHYAGDQVRRKGAFAAAAVATAPATAPATGYRSEQDDTALRPTRMVLPTVSKPRGTDGANTPTGPAEAVQAPAVGEQQPGSALPESEQRVLDAILAGHTQPGAIAEHVGLSRQRVGALLGALAGKDLVTKTGNGPAVRYEAATAAA
ncbi:type IV secretory system conjugative DNA transfer family protein [Amycolatopsis sp. NPDC051903]|uniref:type IV secretory system conjugative DNA transfer family protein n=1 Tax=Amycolatopsis sp. NPDC051903 TaxID=3363936 RepID=UPI003797C008